MPKKFSDEPVEYESLGRYESQEHLNLSAQRIISSSPSDHTVIFSFYDGRFQLSLAQLRYFTFLSIDISILWPWNCFLSASVYFIKKFGAGSNLSNNYSSTMMTVSTLTSFALNSYLSTKQFANFVNRIKLGCLINFSIFIILSLIELFWPTLNSGSYFTFVMLLILLSSVGTCFQQNGCMAIVNVLGPIYAQAVMVGQAIAGVLPSIALMLSNLLYPSKSDDSNGGIVIYFVATSIITLISILLLLITNRYKDDLGTDIEHESPISSQQQPSEYVPFAVLFDKLKFIVSSIFTIFVITLVFPVFASNITSVNPNWGKLTSDNIYIPFIFLVWNLGDLAGRMVCAYPQFVISSDRKLLLYSVLRFVNVPLFFFCNLSKNKGNPIVDSDLFYILLQFTFGFTNGHNLSCCFMNVANYVDDEQKEAAGGFTTIFLSLGLAAGSIFSYLFVLIIS
ncbi:Equilibrative nucleoside transporter 3 [Wickerhamomyces ciferrii]|uniref:Equilibrative nucleoside transporter 3 n=1 Tax=Wickerhamomyces ciferrii (strain ATCC 14091 / BCRC 22168 / CBS 111 / JCM 3599 / NBRC 0793 / NRRL Y-1031 F-60-10) TaxID=1206466 RepID=K0KVX9_WICCF|nr:Equilibrative nucleoside transporter 3 [Wickerhamomyces ciferrii]CCH45268.1 Equilibrative nucleoside transporter 3 [Wickerhamomyces ciferrii]